jgi:soluble lytic murein transglycosylase
VGRTLFFTLFFILSISACGQSQLQVRNDFYQGLNSTDTNTAISCYERALSSTNVYVRRAAAQELAVLMADGKTLSPRTIQKMCQEIHGSWARALDAAGVNGSRRSLPNREKSLAFLLTMDSGTPEEARLFVFKESESLLNEKEIAAANGHYAISGLRYGEALLFFRAFQEDGQWPAVIPEIFIKYPVLINDLGRAFQYTGSGMEGHDLFLRWRTNLLLGNRYSAGAVTEEAGFRLVFFAARIARRNGRNAPAMTLFEQSLAVAPTAEQIDACIWYILDLALRENDNSFLQKMEQYVSRWHNKNYYNDILERFLQTLAAKQDWDRIARTYNIIKESGASFTSGYAWIIARVIEEGYKTTVQLTDKLDYFTAAYNAAGNEMTSVLYYRDLSAIAAGKPFFSGQLMIRQEDFAGRRAAQRTSSAQVSPVMQFINGFFTFNAGEHSLRYIRQLENELSIEDLRAAAGALDNAGMNVHVIRLVTRYMNRADFSAPTRRDIELLFPRPFKDLVEKYAAETNIPPEILFALIRTESAFQPAVISRAGAAGLTQLMPGTAQDIANRIKRSGGPDYSGDNLKLDDPGQNIHIGAFYLNHLNERFENKLLSLLAYNGGQTRVRRLRNAVTLPPDLFMETISISETRDYGRKVMGAAAVYRELYY